MIKHLIIFLILILSSIQLRADCGDPHDCDPDQKGVTVYKHSKTVYYPEEENIKANDCLVVWDKIEKELCFSMDTYSNYFHNCGIFGKATKVKNNEYSYTQKNCHIVLLFLNDKVKVIVTGPRGKNCVNDDLGGGCGINASVESATYMMVRKRP